MGKKLGHLFQYIRVGLLTGAAALVALGLDMPAAFADELADWGYDSETRSLTLTVPPDISPSISVLAPDKLLIELPDTQIGDVAGLTVGDGIVDSIVLEQMTPETLWMVMEFADGTVLETMQSVVPVGDAGSAQQWEVRPSVVASNEPASNAQTNDESAPVVSGGADILRTPEVDVAQADFPDLPILEPGITLSEPISVPPIGTASSASAPPPPPPPPPIAEVSPVDEVPGAIATEDPDEVTASADVPSEPPFLGEGTFEVPVIDETALSESASGSIADESDDVDEPVVVSVPDEPVVEADDLPAESVAAAEPPAVEADAVPEETVASVPGLSTRVDASVAVEAGPNADAVEGEFEPQELDLAGQGVTPQNVDRWPEPIPFGAPLP